MNNNGTRTIVDQQENQLPVPVSQRRLKGLLALLPPTATLYRSEEEPNESEPNWHSELHINWSTKITSKKQQRRRLKRYQKDKLESGILSDRIDVESGNCNDEANETNENATIATAMPQVTIHLRDLIHENDVVVLFLFDPYQPYSLQLLKKLFDVGRHPNKSHECQTGTAIIAENIIAQNQNPAKLHCLVVTSCADTMLIDRLLENSGAMLLPWTNDNGDGRSSDHWKIALGGANLCPSILAIIECSKGRNVFPINHEELALDWNSSTHVYNSWLLQRTSALTTIQRIQAYALYPTSSGCNIN